ncbi:MAG: hypothetical protein HON65_02945 [Rhodospirillales bacterium]|jgi:hypothetical protein|nr:hypothetical protein [Rhodospirillales bacterium]
MAESAESKKKIPSQEKLLIEYVQRMEEHRTGRSVVQLHLSALRPYNRREAHLRAASSYFDNIIDDMAGQIFILKSGDIFFFFKNEYRGDTDTAVQQVRYMFSDDPLIADEDNSNTIFASWFDAVSQFSDIQHIVQLLVNAEDRRSEESRSRMDARAALKEKQRLGDPLSPEILARMETALQRADLSNLLRRQFACKITDKLSPEQVFSELFISIQDLRETLMPDVNLLANRWLFQHMTETLDKRMLSMLSKTDRVTISGDISFNINIRTIMSDEFQNFDASVSANRRGGMIIELQKEDIFSDLRAFIFAREFAQSMGYKICLDGLTLQTLQIIDYKKIGADMLKLVWSPDLVDGGENVLALVKTMVDTMGGENVALCRCDNREAVNFGLAAGIGLYQGRYVETLIAEDDRRRELMRLKRRIERSSDQDHEEDR